MIKTYHQLVRDKIPEIIRSKGGQAQIRTLSDDEYRTYLEAKLDEEVEEYHKDHSAEELADILEVVYALAEANGISRETLMEVYRKKHDERGGFRERILLISSQEG